MTGLEGLGIGILLIVSYAVGVYTGAYLTHREWKRWVSRWHGDLEDVARIMTREQAE